MYTNRFTPFSIRQGIALICVLAILSFSLMGGQSVFAALSVTTVDNSANEVGRFTSVILNSSGNALISYHDVTDKDLKLAICNDATCSAPTITTVDSVGDVGGFTSIDLNSSGNAVISYYDYGNGDLKVAVCNNLTCTAPTLTVVDGSASNVGWYTSLDLNGDNPVISYYDLTNGDLKVAICANPTCSTGNVSVVAVDANVNDVGGDTSLVLAAGGAPVISYNDGTNGDLLLAICSNAACGTVTKRLIDSAAFVGYNTSIDLTTDGRAVISYLDGNNGDLKIAFCSDTTCSTSTPLTLDSTGNTGVNSSLELTTSDLPVISYWDETNGDLKLLVCSNGACSATNTITTVDSVGNVGQYTSLALNTSGNAVISYFDVTNGNLKLAVDAPVILPTATPTATNTATATNTPVPPTATFTATNTNTPLPTATSTATATNTAVPPTATNTATNTSVPPTATNTATNTAIPPTATATATATLTPIPPVTDTIGIYKDGFWLLRNSNSSGLANIQVAFGNVSGDLPVVGDWNNDGVDTIGLYRASTSNFILSNSNTAPSVAFDFVYGAPGDLPLAGRWSSLITGSRIGIFRPSTGLFALRSTLNIGPGDIAGFFGDPGDIPVVGDWNGDGVDTVGLYRSANTVWYLSNANVGPTVDYALSYPISTFQPLIGDWNGDVASSIGYYNGTLGTFGLAPEPQAAGPEIQFAYGPGGGTAVAGKWGIMSSPNARSIIPSIGANPVTGNSEGAE